MKKIITLLFLLMGIVAANAQQLPVYTHLVANRFLINPATVGSVKQPSIDLMVRQQWTGFKGAPQDGIISFQTFFPKYKVGLGAAIYTDKTAALSRNTLNVSYDYRIALSKKLNLSIGMNVLLSQFGINQSKISDALNNDDPVLNKSAHTFLADVGAGAFIFNNRWNLGISSLQLAQSHIANQDLNLEESKNFRHYYLIGGYNAKLSSEFVIRNMVMVRSSFHSPTIAEYMAQFRYNDFIWVQVGMRSQISVLAGAGFAINNQFKIGYTYESPTLVKNRFPGSSHEIYLSFVIPQKRPHDAAVSKVTKSDGTIVETKVEQKTTVETKEEIIKLDKKTAEKLKKEEDKKAAEAKKAAEKKVEEDKKEATKTPEQKAKDAEKKAADEKKAAEKKAVEDKKIADKKLAEEKKAADKKMEEDKKAAKKAADDLKKATPATTPDDAKKATDKQAAEDKKIADKKAADEKKMAEKKLAEEQKATAKKAKEDLKAAEQKAADDKKAAEKKAADEKKNAGSKKADDKKSTEKKPIPVEDEEDK